MMSFNPKKMPHLLSLIVAIITAVGMWYVVSVRDRLEAQLEVSIDYNGVPPNLVITDGLISKVHVRMRGPELLLRAISQQTLTQAINLSGIKKGTTVVPLSGEHMGPQLRAFELIDVQPPRIVVKADNLIERSVPVRAEIESPLRSGVLTVENVIVSPASVTLRGPESVLSDMSHVPLIITLDPNAAGTTVRQNLPLDTPSLVNAMPGSVEVQYTITSGRTVVTRQVRVEVEAQNAHNYAVEPETLELLVEVPEALAKNSSYLRKLGVIVVPPPMEVGQSRQVDPRIRLPEGMTLLNPSLNPVTISRKK